MDCNKVRITPAGLAAVSEADVKMETLEVHVLVMCMSEPRTIAEVVTMVQHHDSAYRFIDVKFIAQAAAQLVDRGYAEYVGPPPTPTIQQRLSRKERRRQRMSGGY